MDFNSASNLPVTVFNPNIHAGNKDDGEKAGTAATSSASTTEGAESESGGMRRRLAGEKGTRGKMNDLAVTIRRNVPPTSAEPLDFLEVLNMKEACYDLLKTAMKERLHRNVTVLSGGGALFAFTMAYFISGKFDLLLKPVTGMNLGSSLQFGMKWRSSFKMRQELKEILKDWELDAKFIEQLDSLEFNKEGLREAARLLQEKMPENEFLHDAADDFIESYAEEPEWLKKSYEMTQHIMRIFLNDKKTDDKKTS